jgi:HrpA-like RNA helicase
LNIFVKQTFDYENSKSPPKSKNIINLESIDLLDAPAVDNVQTGLEKLYVCGAIEPYCVTPLGKLLSAINVPVEIGRMILAGYVYKVSIDDLATIAAGLIIEQRSLIENFKTYESSIGDKIFSNFKIVSKPLLLNGYAKVLEFISDQFIEFILLLDEFSKACMKLEKISKIKEWCLDIGINYDGIMSMIEARDDIQKNMYALGFKSNSCIPLALCTIESEFIDTVRNIKRCEYEGFKMNISIQLDVPGYKGYMSERHKYAIIPQASFVYNTNPKYIMFASATMFYGNKKKSYETKAFTISTLDDWILDEHDSKFTAIQNSDVSFTEGVASIDNLLLYKDINRIQPKSRNLEKVIDKSSNKIVEKTYNKKELKYDKSKNKYVEKSNVPKKGGAPEKILWIG